MNASRNGVARRPGLFRLQFVSRLSRSWTRAALRNALAMAVLGRVHSPLRKDGHLWNCLRLRDRLWTALLGPRGQTVLVI
jgi:hypothetical protein